MPELPDVEVFRRHLSANALHRKIETVHVRDERLLDGISAGTLRRHLKGNELAGTRRHGKLLFVELKGVDRSLLLHFGMTGGLKHYGDGKEPDGTAVLLDFADGSHLAYLNTRTFGRVGLVEDVDQAIEDEDLGPDPLDSDFGLADLRSALEGRSGAIKGRLMDQSVIAGLGNIYADELLFQAGVHPETKVGSLSDDQVKDIHRTMKHVIEKAIEAHVDVEEMPDSWLLPSREAGADCPRCDGTVRKTKVSGRSTYYCPNCQTKE